MAASICEERFHRGNGRGLEGNGGKWRKIEGEGNGELGQPFVLSNFIEVMGGDWREMEGGEGNERIGGNTRRGRIPRG
jgi:hypothetical protein